MKRNEMKLNNTFSEGGEFEVREPSAMTLGLADHVVASALRPGAVLGEHVDGRVNIVSALDDIARGETAGYNARVVGTQRELFPRISKRDYEQLQLTQLPEIDGGLEAMLDGMPHMSKEAKAAFMSTRKLVRQELPSGGSRAVVVARVPNAMTEAEIVEDEYNAGGVVDASGQEVLTMQDLASRRRKRTYTLAQLLNDHDVLAKYELGLRAAETARRLAATEPNSAAQLFQSLMNGAQTHTNVTVRAGDYGRDRPQARNALRQFCSAAPRDDAAVHTLVIMDKVVMFGPGGERDWYVMGPLKYATEVSYVYWLVKCDGFIFPSLLLAMELVLLHIDIFDGHSHQEPEVEFHASIPGADSPPVGLARTATSLLSVDARMQLHSVGSRLLPVMGANGDQLATAVRVTGRYVLVNAHVVEADSQCTVGGQTVTLRTQLSRDLWCARLEGDAEPWALREPVEGELAVVCYLRGGELSCSNPLRVTSVDRSCVVTQLDDSVSFGMSGGALVALNDRCLLGVHSASTRTNLVAYRFGEKQFADLLETDSVTSFSRCADTGSFAERVVHHFKRRGIWNVFQTAVDSLEPVYVNGEHVGMAVDNGEYTYTLCDAELALQLGKERRVVQYESVGEHYYRTPSVGTGTGPLYRRKPNYYEKVFVIGYDEDSYISVESSVAHVGPDARSFIITDIPGVDRPTLGGLVVGWDGAVLGCCGPRSMTTATGLGYPCWPLVRDGPVNVADPRATLVSAFPFLNVAAWPDSLIEEIFTHSSVGAYPSGRTFNAGMKPLSNVGDNAAKAELYRRLRELSYPHSQWASVMQSVQSNNAYAEVAWRMGFAQSLVIGTGVVMRRDSKVYADLTEALIGAVYLLEKPAVLTQLCQTMGILYSPVPPLLERALSIDALGGGTVPLVSGEEEIDEQDV